MNLPARRFILLTAILLGLAPGAHAADAAPAPDYPALVNALFDKAATCTITGFNIRAKPHIFSFTARDAKTLQKLRWIFLREKPLYLGAPSHPAEEWYDSDELHFKWLDAKGKVLGRADMEDACLLSFDNAHLFKTIWKEGDSAPLLARAMDVALPGIYGDLEQPRAKPYPKD